jgi:hypothetical protein
MTVFGAANAVTPSLPSPVANIKAFSARPVAAPA